MKFQMIRQGLRQVPSS